MDWMTLMLAEATNADPDMISGKVLIGVLGAITTLVTGLVAHKAGKSQSFKIDGQPLAVKMEDHFVTRREFENHEARLSRDMAEMKGLFRETQTLVRERDEKLTEAIKQTAENAYNGRSKIWKKVNDMAEIHGARIKSLEDRTPIKTTRVQ